MVEGASRLATVGGGGCSTLDLMKRLEKPSVSPEVLSEMEHILQSDKLHRQLQRARRGDALIADITKLGDVEEARKKLRPIFVPDKPQVRTLRASRLLGPENNKKIITSLVRPLPSTRGTSSDAKSTPPSLPPSASAPVLPTVPLTAAEKELAALKGARIALEHDLLHVTKQLYHKYEKQVFPGAHTKGATFQSLSKRWAAPSLSDSDKYAAYMDGRYATRNDLEFYKKPPPPKDETNSFHRKHKQHTKYGDSLAFAKHSLRGTF
ncbi:hypothetical protein SPRG_04097 [Saprolegnia parasitica CBS 223.65]|uniref:Uncharacterized protein n=1 Tax=Saprolegnia parasitica (strain CBS 223.65) TaxID=695850 RepID=A0A067CXE5_SAPPC|nr:hypothetical protein SPRG_04097 [Saprolegnia parasitica CBS 223.65]KDO31482.1 hypothetical protein SPRG_04097 [Saprolegnia parasitica CBS 223.65]|eukprot:XP_012198075.1 hypothetical protein SPRG_04097 [Saprolegnia parasitica CBS 223.65]